jgi:uncharacterized protein YndB with AHSA1/START domain
MSISFEHAIDVARPPERVFAVLEDASLTPSWLAPCKGVVKLTPGPNQVGSMFRYAYQAGGRSGTMDGVITARIPNERLSLVYHDSLMDVVADFRLTPTGMGTWLIHTIDVTPKSFFAKMFAPLIRSRLPSHVIQAMDALRQLIETSDSPEARPHEET